MDYNTALKNNLKSFKEAFKDYEDYYTVIGGTACLLLMEDIGRRFRATKDIDMILILEGGEEEFCRKLWDYLISGGYKCYTKDGKPHYYRFSDPVPGYPAQIELFSKRADFRIDSRIIPVHISEDISSLSAIALDNDFYSFMKSGRHNVDEISILEAEYIIPFKMLAWLNNRDMKAQGLHVNSRDITKHYKDIVSLMDFVSPIDRVITKGNVRITVKRFVDEITREYESDNLNKELDIDLIKSVYLS